MDEVILKQLTDLAAEQKSFVAKFSEEIKNLGAAQPETKTALEALDKRLKDVQTQADAIDLKIKEGRGAADPEQKSLGEQFIASETYQEFFTAAKNGHQVSKKGLAVHLQSSAFVRKSNITDSGLGTATSGVLVQQRIPGVLEMAKQGFRIRDIIQVQPIDSNSWDAVTQNTRTNAASPQVEAVTKAESTYGYTTINGTVKTLAHFVNVSRQALADAAWLRAQLDGELLYGLKLKEEAEVLAGSGTGEHLNGIITQATAYDSATYDVAATGWTKLDQLRYAKLQSRLAGLLTFGPDAIVLNPVDMAAIELIKDNDGGAGRGHYIVGDPKTGAPMKFIWDLPVVESDSITAGTFLVGPFGSGAVLFDRMAATVEISYEHSSNFTANLATILCEERVGLAVTRPTGFISGTFGSSSPA